MPSIYRNILSICLCLLCMFQTGCGGVGIMTNQVATDVPSPVSNNANPDSSTAPHIKETPKTTPVPTPALLSAATPVPMNFILSYEELAKTAVLVDVDLLATPLYVDSFLPDTSIKSGETVQLIGTDKNSAWLLVLHRNAPGWIPAIYTNIGVGSMNAFIIPVADSASCNQYLGSLTLNSVNWESSIQGAANVQGIIYQPAEEAGEKTDILSFVVEETGQPYYPEMTTIPISNGGRLITFTTMIENLETGYHVKYNLNGLMPFQAALFTQDCSVYVAGTTNNTGQNVSNEPTPTMDSITIRIISTTGPPIYPTSDFNWSECHVKYKTRLTVGARAYVSAESSLSNNVREKPYKDSAVLGKIKPNEKMTIIKGPSCSSGYIWWKIKADRTGLTGWTVEGDNQSYWLVPIN